MSLIYWILIGLFFAPFINWFFVLSRETHDEMARVVQFVGGFAFFWGVGVGIAISHWLL